MDNKVIENEINLKREGEEGAYNFCQGLYPMAAAVEGGWVGVAVLSWQPLGVTMATPRDDKSRRQGQEATPALVHNPRIQDRHLHFLPLVGTLLSHLGPKLIFLKKSRKNRNDRNSSQRKQRVKNGKESEWWTEMLNEIRAKKIQ